jgi:hypothetical protein
MLYFVFGRYGCERRYGYATRAAIDDWWKANPTGFYGLTVPGWNGEPLPQGPANLSPLP